MYRTSSAYKAEMAQDLRDRSFVYVYLGLINRDAQAAASITSELADFAQNDVFENSRFEAYYATCEKNFAKVNETMYFMPDEAKYYSTLDQGAVSKDIQGEIIFSFSETIDKFGGLTIDFGDYPPTSFTATNGHNTYAFEPTSGQYIAQGVFENSDYIKIIPTTERRLRIHSIMFGIGFQFDNKNLISTKRTNEIDHLSRELPKKTFEFTIDNFNQNWTMDNPNSFARSLEEMQIVQVIYGRELPNGSIYKIPSGYMALQSWSNTHSQATFKAVGFLDYSNTTYYGGKVGRTSLYDLAVRVFEDMGTTDYKIDTFLKKLYTDNPLPIEQHKVCLQMIANAGLCSMYENGNGVITLKSSMKSPRYDVTVENIEPYSNTDSFMNGDTVYNFATCERDYAKVNGSLRFIDDITTVGQTGLVSYLYPTEEGMRITIEFEAVWTFTGLSFQWGIISPSTVTIAEYNDGSVVETHDYEVDDMNFYIDHEFYEVDKLVITFSNPDDTRIHLNKMLIGTITDYEITEHDMMNLPETEQTERVRSVNVKYYDFIEGDKKVTAQTNADVGENLVTFNTPCYGYSVEGCTITDSGAYYVIFEAETAGKVTIEAKQYDKAENTYSYRLRETGQDVTLENDLISDADLAERVCEWLAEFYAGEIDYTVSYRGEPALESGDRIYLENRFVNSNLVLVTSEELTTGIGMSMTNTVKARQLQYARMD